MGVRIPTGRGTFEEGDMYRPTVTYIRRATACPAHAANECIRRIEGWQNCDAAFCQMTLDTCLYLVQCWELQYLPDAARIGVVALGDVQPLVDLTGDHVGRMSQVNEYHVDVGHAFISVGWESQHSHRMRAQHVDDAGQTSYAQDFLCNRQLEQVNK